MESTTKERAAAESTPASSNAAISTAATIGSRGLHRPRPATPKLQGCAREGCLEVAKLGSDRCPLHDQRER
jgi:hypothetical protein